MTIRSVSNMLNVRLVSQSFEPICLYSQCLLDRYSYSREHLVPLSRITSKAAAADLHNIWPCSIGINIAKSNYMFVDGNTEGVDTKKKLFTPPHHAKGIIARTCMHMEQIHEIDLTQVIDPDALYEWLSYDVTPYELRHVAFVNHFQQKLQFKIEKRQ